MNIFKKIVLKIPSINNLYQDVKIYKKGYPPGHYYSPIVSKEEVEVNKEKIFSLSSVLRGISLNTEEQKILLYRVQKNYREVPYLHGDNKGLRYYFNNNTFEHADAIFLNLLIRELKPKRIIEIGSGFSSAIMMDANELYFNNSIALTFIEPYPDRLHKLMKLEDYGKVTIIPKKVQDISIELYSQLESGDILFVDSTHVSKTGSDVNTILFTILPILPKGVIIHFHDIFYPFEYPKEWVLGWSGFGWNEIYLLRAFLTNNKEYKIILFNTYLEHIYEDWFIENMPVCLKDKGGSLWLEKV